VGEDDGDTREVPRTKKRITKNERNYENTSWLVRLSSVLRRASHERELSAELQSHLDLDTAANVRAGMTPEEARQHDSGRHRAGVAAVVRD
jgi:hypothetical protein